MNWNEKVNNCWFINFFNNTYSNRILFINIFFVGGYLSGSVFPRNIVVTSDNVTIDGMTGNSALTFRNYTYFIENNKLHIKLCYVLHSKFYPNPDFHIDINDNSLSSIEGIYFTNGETKKIAWSKKYTIEYTMEPDRDKFLQAEKFLLSKYKNDKDNLKVRVCYEVSVTDKETNIKYMVLPLQNLSDSTIISTLVLNTNTGNIYEGNFDTENIKLSVDKKVN